MTALSQGDQQMIIFEDVPRHQTVFLEVPNRFGKRMKFGWETSFGFFFKVTPATGTMDPGETKTFEIQFQGDELSNTDIMDSDHCVKMWWMPAETRKRGLENTKINVPILFAIHVQPKRVMEFDGGFQ